MPNNLRPVIVVDDIALLRYLLSDVRHIKTCEIGAGRKVIQSSAEQSSSTVTSDWGMTPKKGNELFEREAAHPVRSILLMITACAQ